MVADVAGHGHAAHRADLQVDHDGVDLVFEGAAGSGGGVVEIGELEVGRREGGVDLVSHPWNVGNDEDSAHRREDSPLGFGPILADAWGRRPPAEQCRGFPMWGSAP